MTDPSVYFNPYCMPNSSYCVYTSKYFEFSPQTPKCGFIAYNSSPNHNRNPFWHFMTFFTNES